ncbi:hypothetical protein RCO22_12375 [Pseudomonas yamanorum]|uniref:Uncharacterized protein n=1 Tax=Pseudomonas yamanorum TaxID=515393 RepID=A0ABU1CR41_9PSED|nr:hypothetical protein [Pseudomonas yamanorum]MDR0189736.1 hypothetical protein [Pseudomonas yamanorum]
MKNPQNNTIALPALLRTVSSVNALETNSLCCEAAGIIAPSSATAEALIPHEKLRGAALADATLNAQESTLAQPAEGYKHIDQEAGLLSTSLEPCTHSHKNALESIPVKFHILKMMIECGPVLGAKRPTVTQCILQNTASFTDTLEGLQCWLERSFAHGLRNNKHQRLMNTFHTFQSRRCITWPIKRPANCCQRRYGLLDNTLRQKNRSNLNTQFSLTTCSTLQLMSSSCNHESTDDSPDRSDRLNPCSSVVSGPMLKHQNHRSTYNKRPNWRYSDFQQGFSFKTNFFGKHLWPLAIIQPVIVNKSWGVVHGGSV